MFVTLAIFFCGLSYCVSVHAFQRPNDVQEVQPGEVCTVVSADDEQNRASSAQLSSNQATKVENFMPCQCYCSDLCDMRARKADDTPFVDPETGICFCKQRDKDNYIPHGCATKPQAVVKPELGPTCCGK